jgi:2-amino-4-hydroxy-6-hydroxymethyldihydropteridine diphosphokinase
MAERVFVGLGANLGDARATLQAALLELGALPNTALVAQSPTYASKPIAATGPDYVNAVAELLTALEPADLLVALQAIESRFGRQRPYPNAPRTLDLDLLLYGQRALATATLTVPHPRLHQRAFALLPLLDLAPDLSHPLLGPFAAFVPSVSTQSVHQLP